MDINLSFATKSLYLHDKEIQHDKGLFVNSSSNKEYSIYINSKDRDLESTRNPFNFTIEFMSRNTRNINIPILVSSLNYLYVKQVYLPATLLTESILSNKYFVLRIKELNMQYQFCSSSNFNNSTDIILYSVGFSNNYLILDSKLPVQFNDELKPSIKKLTFQIFDGNMNPLNVISNLNNPSSPDSWQIDFSSSIESPLNPNLETNNIFIDVKLGINDDIGLNKFASKHEN